MGKTRRLNKILAKDGRSFVVAMDHGTFGGPVPGLEQPSRVIEQVVEGGANAILANPGFARKFAKEMAGTGFICRLDIPPTMAGPGVDHASRLVFDVDLALKLGADAVIVNGGPGEGEKDSIAAIASVVKACEGTGMPVIGEVVPGGFDADPKYKTLENLILGARIVSELGVDLIKIAYMPGFEKVVEGAFCPLLVLGGSKSNDPAVFLASIKNAMTSGASGVAIGRNAWGADDPVNMTKALAAIIHGNVSIEEAVALLNG
jgi:fructose-bisphosphate aldolase / 2-amino-3,7-dideoxy-D-threo-hept-6-ulosonate synthase